MQYFGVFLPINVWMYSAIRGSSFGSMEIFLEADVYMKMVLHMEDADMQTEDILEGAK